MNQLQQGLLLLLLDATKHSHSQRSPSQMQTPAHHTSHAVTDRGPCTSPDTPYACWSISTDLHVSFHVAMERHVVKDP